ncbi:hypothetical protein SKAU_G00292810 [Synaphobranchus kaupii]|uniref:Uncharacterized protein n=1 Tax=Synaphobranchus kaupii TaxID=118154 RepID=A0A9Q1IMG1_SYNKA|nr:hypothetical protein SKAU_G00292810 [Synaphobranchus kaupii]
MAWKSDEYADVSFECKVSVPDSLAYCDSADFFISVALLMLLICTAVFNMRSFALFCWLLFSLFLFLYSNVKHFTLHFMYERCYTNNVYYYYYYNSIFAIANRI